MGQCHAKSKRKISLTTQLKKADKTPEPHQFSPSKNPQINNDFSSTQNLESHVIPTDNYIPHNLTHQLSKNLEKPQIQRIQKRGLTDQPQKIQRFSLSIRPPSQSCKNINNADNRELYKKQSYIINNMDQQQEFLLQKPNQKNYTEDLNILEGIIQNKDQINNKNNSHNSNNTNRDNIQIKSQQKKVCLVSNVSRQQMQIQIGNSPLFQKRKQLQK